MNRFLLGIVLGAGLALIGGGLAAQEAPLVKLQVLSTDEAQNLRQFYGKVAARQSVDLAFQVTGQIIEFPVLEGTTLPQGGLIAQLDLEPFTLQLNQAQAQANQAQRTLQRLQQLQGSAVSRANVEDAQTQADLAAIQLRNAQRALSLATLNAPFDALVASRNVANFATVGAGAPVVRLHDMSELRVEIDVPEVLFREAGRDPNFQITARFPGSDVEYPLTPREFHAETAGVGQTFRLSMGLETPEDTTILPGSSATVKVVRAWGAERPVVPISAIVTNNDGSASVMRFAPVGADTGTVTRVPVEIAPTADGKVRIESGAEVGDEIVVSGGGLLEDGAEVRRFQGFGN